MISGLGADVILFYVFFLAILFIFIKSVVSSRAQNGSASPVTNDDSDEVSDVPLVRTQSMQEDCSICLEVVRFPCQTNCGHYFCTACFIDYWRRSRRARNIACPNCRSQVNMLHDHFPAPEADNREEAGNMQSAIAEFNQPASVGFSSVFQAFRDSPVLFRLAWNDFRSGNYALLFNCIVKLHSVLVLLVVMFYILSPFDLFPEAVFGIVGVLDDLVVVMGLLVYGSNIYRRALLRRSQRLV